MKYVPVHRLVELEQSLPSRGAWIEIMHSETVDGLKAVAPLAGSVD